MANPSVMTPLSRLSFANLAKPRLPQNASEGAKPKYSATLVFDPSTMTPKDKARLKKLKSAALDAMREKFGDKAFKSDGKLKSGYKLPFRKGEEKSDQYPDSFQDGFVFINAKTESQPGIADARNGRDNGGKWPEAESAGDAYSGCYVRATVQFYGYDVSGNKGVGVGLNNILIIKDGERLGGGINAKDDFQDIDDDELEVDDEDDHEDDDDENDLI